MLLREGCVFSSQVPAKVSVTCWCTLFNMSTFTGPSFYTQPFSIFGSGAAAFLFVYLRHYNASIGPLTPIIAEGVLWNWHCFWNLAVETLCDDHLDIAKIKIRAWHRSPSTRVTQTLAICFCFYLCWSCVCAWWSRVVTELLTAGREDKQSRDSFWREQCLSWRWI